MDHQQIWTLASFHSYNNLLGGSVRQHVSDRCGYRFPHPIILILTTKPTGPDRWKAAMALYMIGFISYGATLVFYAALFPRLARNTPHARDLREKYEHGEVTPEVFEVEESMEKNRISNISTVGFPQLHLQHGIWRIFTYFVSKMHSNIGYIATLCLNLSLLLPLKTNNKVDNYVIVLTNGYWVLTGIWWCKYSHS